jgi:hypothetical protein
VWLVALPSGAAGQPRITPGECATVATVTRCLFRSSLPSAGLISECEASRCRVGSYAGALETVRWLPLPGGWTTFPPPEVVWVSSTFAEVRFRCGPSCSLSYFFDARRRRVSPSRSDVLALDGRRLLVAMGEAEALVVRQIFSGREVARIEREWAPGLRVVEAVRSARFDPDGRLSFTWLKGAPSTPVAERLSIPSLPR